MELKIEFKDFLKGVNKITLVKTKNKGIYMVIVNDNYIDAIHNTIFYNAKTNKVFFNNN